MTHSFKTAEFVSPKHPDKLCDRIADAILDAHLAQDPDARAAIEVVGGHGQIFLTGEVSSRAEVDIRQIVKRIAGSEIKIITNIAQQSPEIASGVDTGGAGDQGIMIGYATSETPELLPLEYALARDLNQYLYEQFPYDGKTQVTTEGDRVRAVVASFQNVSETTLFAAVLEWLKQRRFVGELYTFSFDKEKLGRGVYVVDTMRVLINPAGDWQIGGFDADAGLTGRKLIVDNYGPRIPIGGGAFSGKDPSKVDRSAAYIARKIAVEYLKKLDADEVLVRLAYAIGYDQPLEATVVVDGETKKIEGYDLSPRGIAKALDLKRPIYEDLATHGHFGRKNTPWQ